MQESPNTQHGRLSPGAHAFLDDHLAKIRERIIEEAARQAGGSPDGAIEPMVVAEAAKSFAPGGLVPLGAKRVSTMQRLLEPVSGLTLVCAVLAIIFGLLGLWANSGAGAANAANTSGWLDVAKVFAGAVVGSTGAGVVSSVRALTSQPR